MREFKTWVNILEAEQQNFSGPNPYVDQDTGAIKDQVASQKWEAEKRKFLAQHQQQNALVTLPDGRTVKRDRVYSYAWDEIAKSLMNNADGFAANQINDPWIQHQGFRAQAINVLKKYGLDKNRAAVDKIFGPQGVYYKGAGGLAGNPLAFIRKKIEDPNAFGGGRPQTQPTEVPVANASQFPSTAQSPQHGIVGKLASGIKNFFGN